MFLPVRRRPLTSIRLLTVLGVAAGVVSTLDALCIVLLTVR